MGHSIDIFCIEVMPTSIMSDVETLSTAPFDARFPNQNQTRNCWQNFVDFYRCRKVKGDDYEPCNYFKKVYQSLCPNSWVEKWQEQIEEGRFPGKI
ncbi:cytochrome c oxidase subunit 6B isoform X1 [Tachypleus tridentatus]|uniref:cytochrome c oxidase subunit 6B isoform X1 n=2 Tax=Tachypleus tridentatus TaxID=6853 RepID=UPI003FD085BE